MSFGIQHIWEASKNPFIYLNKSAGPQVQVEINYIRLYYEHSKACSKLKKKRKKEWEIIEKETLKLCHVCVFLSEIG